MVIEHAWKSTPPARAEAHQILPAHVSINKFRNNGLLRSVLVTDALDVGLQGVCDTDKSSDTVPKISCTDAYVDIPASTVDTAASRRRLIEPSTIAD